MQLWFSLSVLTNHCMGEITALSNNQYSRSIQKEVYFAEHNQTM